MLDGISHWTLHRDTSALAKFFRFDSADFGVKLPPRRRCDVSRYHNVEKDIAQFDQIYPQLAQICKETSLRRRKLHNLMSIGDVRIDDEDNIRVMVVRQGKGVRQRDIYALGDARLRMAQQAQAEGRECICRTVPPHAPVHVFFHIFAQNTYAKFARPDKQIPKKDRYVCRGDMKGIVLDKRTMRSVSKALSHNRLGVLTHYLNKP